ncbi:hypothetical protein KEM48_008471 [Puccinia striiformis f. sp. tritici PST-130]|nr:hypothetical protein KEM48_008471 [Puccinia striiformis f. sp. tritici PST-130]
MERPRKLEGLRVQQQGGTVSEEGELPATSVPTSLRTNPPEEPFELSTRSPHRRRNKNFAKKMNDNQPTRDELTAISALLDQKRQAAIEYQGNRQSRGGEPSGSTSEETQRGTDLMDNTQGGDTVDGARNERNRLDEILGSLRGTPAVGERQTAQPRQTTQPDSQPPAPANDREKDRSFLLRAARWATERGDQKGADALLRSLAAMFPEQETASGEQNDNPTATQTTTPTENAKTGGITDEEGVPKDSIRKIGGVSYMIGEVPDYTFAGLPSFYDKNVKAMKGSIPLPIFDPVWQRMAAANRTEKKTIDRADTEERRYTGTAAAEEWSQSYAQWSRNYQGFITTLKDVYNFELFSSWFCTHRDRCDQIMRRKGFCTGFRYDLAVRANAFQCDFVRNETTLFPDVSKYREDIAEETLAEARRFGEIGLSDNPYINGGKKEHYDPHTGKEKTLYSRDRNDERGRIGNRTQSRSTPGRSRGDYQVARGAREDYDQEARFRREENVRGEGHRNRNGETGYDDRTKDRPKNFKPQHGHRFEPTRGRRRFE